MDIERVILRVRGFMDLIDRSRSASGSMDDVGTIGSRLNDEIKRQLPLMRQIAQQVRPDLVSRIESHSVVGEWPWSQARDATIELVGFLEGEQEIAAMLAPTGPRLTATDFHPWVWEPAARLWDQGNRRLAIQNAATTVDRNLQAKLGRLDLSGGPLVTSAFNPRPPTADEKRLRLPGFLEGTDDWTSAHQGAMNFGQGCMLAIRNLSTHRQEEPDEQTALEQLAAMSILARWIDEANVAEA